MKKYRVSTHDGRDFIDQKSAREYAIKLLRTGCFFINIEEVEVDDAR